MSECLNEQKYNGVTKKVGIKIKRSLYLDAFHDSPCSSYVGRIRELKNKIKISDSSSYKRDHYRGQLGTQVLVYILHECLADTKYLEHLYFGNNKFFNEL